MHMGMPTPTRMCIRLTKRTLQRRSSTVLPTPTPNTGTVIMAVQVYKDHQHKALTTALRTRQLHRITRCTLTLTPHMTRMHLRLFQARITLKTRGTISRTCINLDRPPLTRIGPHLLMRIVVKLLGLAVHSRSQHFRILCGVHPCVRHT